MTGQDRDSVWYMSRHERLEVMYSMIQRGTAQDRTGLDRTGRYHRGKIGTCRDG